MSLAFNEEQRSLLKTAREIAQHRSPVEAFRKQRQQLATDPFSRGFDDALWSEMVELGWTGMPFPESCGGFGFGYMGLAGCLQELGRTLTPSPLMSSVVLAGSTVLLAGTEEQRQRLLPEIIGGTPLWAMALDEQPYHRPNHIETTATAHGDNFHLQGRKQWVIDGQVANRLIVVARTSGAPDSRNGISLFWLDAQTPGVRVEPVRLIDSRGYAQITFDQVNVPASQLLGERDNGFAALDQALDRARICLCAEMLGGIEEIFQRTVHYLKERKQFGAYIGSFQALQHRAAHLYTQIEMCKSSLMHALSALENAQPGFPALCSAAKAIINETYELVSNEAVQMHGGIGVTDELDIGLFLKRARVSAELFGHARFHYDRFATLSGY